MIPISYNVRSLLVRKATTLASALGIALVVFVLASSQMLVNGIYGTMARSGSRSHAIALRKGADAELSSMIEQGNVSRVLAAPGVKRSSSGAPLGTADLVFMIALSKTSDDRVANVQVRGVSDNALTFRPEVRMVAGRPPKAGTDEAIVGSGLQGRFPGLEIGRSFELRKNRSVEVVGVFEANGSAYESEIWVDIDTLRTSFGRAGLVSSITVALDATTGIDAFRRAVERDKRLDVQVVSEFEYFERTSEGLSALVGFLGGATVFLFGIGAVIGATITMYGTVANRKREIGTLRALGFSRVSILGAFVVEALVLALCGGVVGAVASLAMSSVRVSMMNQSTWSEVVFSFEPSFAILLTAVGGGALMGVLGGLFPAIRAARVSPLAAMRE